MRTFLTVWLGQVVSLLGSKLTEFALGVWIYEQTGSITQFAIAVLLIYLPNVLVSPLAGVLVDRWSRRWAMILSDGIAAVSTVVAVVLVFSGHLAVWHVYVAIAIRSVFEAFQWPAYVAAIAQLVPKRHLSRANGMVQVSRAIGKLIAPLMAGFLMKAIALEGVLLVDFATFLVAMAALLAVRFPPYRSPLSPKRSKQPLWQRLFQETRQSWHYVTKHPGLVKLLLFVSVIYYTTGTLEVVFWPYILSFASSAELGLVLSVGGCGMLLGSLAISTWGGPKRRIYGMVALVPLQGILIIVGAWQFSLMVAGGVIFAFLFAQPIIVSCNQSIWQSKVPLALQGRVFALQTMLERSFAILAYSLSGPIADYILEPLMLPDGGLG
ncbi:MAG: MFS transporter, partial [Chloroflexaceae bacterium]|nr:MFS transporter [Chloroflexaceae bacterium]